MSRQQYDDGMTTLDVIEEMVLSDERRILNLTPMSETWGWMDRITEIAVQALVNLAVPFFLARRFVRKAVGR